MATFQTRNGRTRAIIRKPNLQASKTFDRLTDAKVWARAKEREADLGDVLPSARHVDLGTFGDLIDRYEREMWPVKKWGRSKAHELKKLGEDWGDKTFAEINRQSVVDYARRLSKKMDRPGIATRLSYLRTVLKTARDLWDMPTPVGAVDEAISVATHHRIAGRGIPRTRRPMSEEIDKIVTYAQEQQRAEVDLAAIVRVLEVLPLRVGELCAIQWDDLHPQERAVMIRSRKHPDSRVKDTNDQLVPLPKVGKVDTFKMIADRPRYLTRPFPCERSSVSSSFWLAVKVCGIEDLHLHDLRAHAISNLLAKGVPIPVVATISGHRNWKLLSRVYERIVPREAHAAIARATR